MSLSGSTSSNTSKIIGFVIIMICVICFALRAPMAQADSSSQCFTPSSYFSSALDAVITASNTFNPLSIREDREFMGIILQKKGVEGKYMFTTTAGKAKEDRVNMRMQVPENHKIVAFWHTHGSAHWSRTYFSESDTNVARRWQVPFYLADHSGKLKIFNPDDKVYKRSRKEVGGLGNLRRYGKGRYVKDPSTGNSITVNTKKSDSKPVNYSNSISDNCFEP